MQDCTTPEVLTVQDLLDLSGKTALVTGASGGIGSAIAYRLAEAGAAVIVHYHRNAAQANAAVEKIEITGGKACALQADLRQEAGCKTLLQQASEQLSRPDILVNNAGIQPVSSLSSMAETELREVLDANIAAPVLLTRCFADLHHASTDNKANNSISVTNIASIEGSQPAAGHAHYASSKAALIMFTRAAALELGRLGIRVNAVSPGLIERAGLKEDWPEGVTRYTEAAPLGRLGSSTDVADAVLYLSSAAARWVTGSNLVVDGGVNCAQNW